MMEEYDAFISFATEDSDFATEIAFELKRNGLSVWFAPISLKVGEKLLDAIEKGLDSTKYGILLISDHYLEKGWTNYEMDILIRQSIEKNKTILPIWYGVDKIKVGARHPGLAGIVAITKTGDIRKVISKLIESMSLAAPSRGVIPIWESPVYRFVQGFGEVNLNDSDGPATTIFEFLIHSKNSAYPFWIGGKLFTKQDLLLEVAQYMGADPQRVEKWVGKDGYQKIWQMCLDNGINPRDYY
jgi:hypothetical protein